MSKKLIFAAFLALAAFAFAQVPVVGPTSEGADAVDKGPDSASVNQTVKLILPQATALHLDTTVLTFDLSALDGEGWPHSTDPFQKNGEIACVYAFGPDVTTQLGDTFWNQMQVLPGGTSYSVADWPYITINGNGVVDSYPPIELDESGELIEGSKGYFVCYKSFVLQLFSNWDYWDLTANRNDIDDDFDSIEHLYIQGNTCYSYGNAMATGLYDLPDGATRHLIPKTLNFGPTGDQVLLDNVPEDCQGKSWLDTLVVVAVKINSDRWGENRADLTYTLQSADVQFGSDMQ
ncbi:hypothetical protein [Oceanithermus sp.]|uniref:hypothetical protein n=1 Tax=Oceanithermus sp. TaxID=2268145 RepID=UPI0025F2A3B1|nr:hypothetical protein [Oceanithermus sp.]